MKYKDVNTKEEHGPMEAGGSTLPYWGIHRNLISALCVLCSNWHLARTRCPAAQESLYCG